MEDGSLMGDTKKYISEKEKTEEKIWKKQEGSRRMSKRRIGKGDVHSRRKRGEIELREKIKGGRRKVSEK